MSLKPKPEIEKLSMVHGGINYAELEVLGLDAGAILDFSVGVNPYPLPGIKKLVSRIDIMQYPDSEAFELREKLSQKLGVSTANIIVGSGTTELIRLIPLAYFRQEEPVLIIEPAYADYEVACCLVGARLVKQRLKAEDYFDLKVEETVNLIKQERAGGVFICNPNSPTGKYFLRKDIETILAAGEDTLFVLDEAYVNFVAKPLLDSPEPGVSKRGVSPSFTSSPSPEGEGDKGGEVKIHKQSSEARWSSTDLITGGNVIILRSMTKDYALAGLRLGYAIAHEEIIRNLRRVCPPWNVNIFAQKAGVLALEAEGYLERSQKKIIAAKQFLVKELERLGFRVLPSDTHFFLVKVRDARTFRTALLKHGILVRDCTSFGLPEYVRIGPRAMPECRKLIATIKRLIRQGEIQ